MHHVRAGNPDRIYAVVAQQANRSSFETFAILANVIAGFLAPEVEKPLQLKLSGRVDPHIALVLRYLDFVELVLISIVKVLQHVTCNLHLIPAHTPSRSDGA